MLVRRLLLVLGLGMVALVAPWPASTQTSYPIETYTAESTITNFVDARKTEQDSLFGSYANPSPGNYVEMTQAQLWAATTGIMQALVGDYQAASNTLGPIGLRSYWLTSTDARVYFVVKEPGTPTKGWGSIVIYPEALRNLVIAAPHVTHDNDSHTSARRFFLAPLRPKMLVLSGAFKCNNLTVSGCQHVGATSCAGLAAGNRNVSDLNHAVTNLMQAAALAARNLDMRFWSIHSNSVEPVHLMFGDGVGSDGRAILDPTHFVRRLRAQFTTSLAGTGVSYATCNDPLDAEVPLTFCDSIAGDTQSRIMNGKTASPFSPDGEACTPDADPDTSSDLYATFELQAAARSALAEHILPAIAAVYPPDLPGTGQ